MYLAIINLAAIVLGIAVAVALWWPDIFQIRELTPEEEREIRQKLQQTEEVKP